LLFSFLNKRLAKTTDFAHCHSDSFNMAIFRQRVAVGFFVRHSAHFLSQPKAIRRCKKTIMRNAEKHYEKIFD